MPIDKIRKCTYIWSKSYDPNLNDTAGSISISQVEQFNGVFYSLVDVAPPLFLDDAALINGFLQSLLIDTGGSIEYTFVDNVAQIIGYNLHNPLLRAFLIRDINNMGGLGPMPFQENFTENYCTFVTDPQYTYGCTDPDAANYDPAAQINIGNCAYTPTTDAQRLYCGISHKGYDLYTKLRTGMLSSAKYDCMWKELSLLAAVVKSISQHKYAGTIIVPAAAPIPGIDASAIVDWSDIFNSYGYFTWSLAIDGVILAQDSAGFYYIDTDDLADDVDGNFPIVPYTSSVVGSVQTIAPPLGSYASYNNTPVQILGSQLYFFIKTTIQTNFTHFYCGTYGCYDPVNKYIVYGTNDLRAFIYISTGAVPVAVAVDVFNHQGGECIYNPTTGMCHQGFSIPGIGGGVYILDTGNPTPAILSPVYTVIDRNPYYAVYNPLSSYMFFSCNTGLSLAATQTGSVCVVSSAIPTGGLINNIPLPAGAFPNEITVNPDVLSPCHGYVYVTMIGLAGITVIDPAGAGIAGQKATNIQPKSLCFVLTATGYELWVQCGGGIINRFNCDTVVPTLLGSFTIANIGGIINMKQNSVTGWVYISVPGFSGGFCVVDPNTHNVLNGTVLLPITVYPNGDAPLGLVENTDTGEMWVAISDSNNPQLPPQFLILDYTQENVQFDGLFTGGFYPADFNRDEVVWDEDESCYTDEEADTQIQWAMNKIIGCCD